MLVVYDLVLYIVRSIIHELPFVGGRARGRQRPRAPSLTERPSGKRRTSLAGLVSGVGTGTGSEVMLEDDQEVKSRQRNNRGAGGGGGREDVIDEE